MARVAFPDQTTGLHLGVINEPNKPGTKCDFEDKGLPLASGKPRYGLPAVIQGGGSATACCDRLAVSPPAPDANLSITYKTFEVYNVKNPVSAICSIDVKMSPTPFTGNWAGGNLALSSGSALVPATTFVYPYVRIPEAGSIAAVSGTGGEPAVKMNLGVDSSKPYHGSIELTVNHCDGSESVCKLVHGPWQ